MSDSAPDPATRERARQKLILQIVIVVLVAGALAIVFLARSIPLSTRLFVAATDLTVAGVMIVLLRQKFAER